MKGRTEPYKCCELPLTFLMKVDTTPKNSSRKMCQIPIQVYFSLCQPAVGSQDYETLLKVVVGIDFEMNFWGFFELFVNLKVI